MATGVSKSAITKLTGVGAPLAQSNWFEIEDMVGNALTVTVKMVDCPQYVYVITDVPPERPVTSPEAFTVATAGVADDHIPPFNVCDNCEVAPTAITFVPVIWAKYPGTKLLDVLDKLKLVIAPVLAEVVASNKVVTLVFVPLAIPWLKL